MTEQDDGSQPVDPTTKGEAQELGSEKNWTIGDVLSAKTKEEVAKAFFEAKQKANIFYLFELQSATGERLVELGEFELGMKFVFLAGETKNTAQQTKNARSNYAAAQDMKAVSRQMLAANKISKPL